MKAFLQRYVYFMAAPVGYTLFVTAARFGGDQVGSTIAQFGVFNGVSAMILAAVLYFPSDSRYMIDRTLALALSSAPIIFCLAYFGEHLRVSAFFPGCVICAINYFALLAVLSSRMFLFGAFSLLGSATSPILILVLSDQNAVIPQPINWAIIAGLCVPIALVFAGRALTLVQLFHIFVAQVPLFFLPFLDPVAVSVFGEERYIRYFLIWKAIYGGIVYGFTKLQLKVAFESEFIVSPKLDVANAVLILVGGALALYDYYMACVCLALLINLIALRVRGLLVRGLPPSSGKILVSVLLASAAILYAFSSFVDVSLGICAYYFAAVLMACGPMYVVVLKSARWTLRS